MRSTIKYTDSPPQSKTAWLKLGRVDFMTFVGKDVVAFARGCYIILYNILLKTETLYIANSAARGEGVQCLVGYQSAYMYAFAEMSLCPRIFLLKYPTHEHISVFQDGEKMHSYLAMSFAEMECLVCLMGIPSFELVVWCWRTGEKLASEPSYLFSLDQLIRCGVSMPIGVGQLSRYENGSTLLMWEIHICSTLCVLNKTEVKNGLDPGTYVTAFCWSPEGILYITDREGNVYSVEEGNLDCKKVCSWPVLSPNFIVEPVNLLWMKGGVVVSGPDSNVKFFKKITRTEFTETWTLVEEGPLLSMAVNRYRDMLAVWNRKATLFHIVTEPKEGLVELKYYGQGFRLLQLIHPSDFYFATVGDNCDLCVWSIETGNLLEQVMLEQVFVHDMASNPQMPYLALARHDGAMELISIYSGLPTSLIVLYLCSDELNGVIFNETGSLIIVASYEIGRIFVTQGLVGTGRRLKVLDHCLTNERIISMVVTTSQAYSKLVLVVSNNENESPSGNELSIYNLPKLEPMLRIELDKPYVEIIRRGKRFIGVPYLSRQLELFDLDLREGSMTVIGTVSSGHQIRSFHINCNGNHFVSYGWDGLVHIRNIEDMNIFCTFQPHHRINLGIKMAVMDQKGKYVITLGKEGNLLCNEVLTSCRHTEEEHRTEVSYDETYFRRQTVFISQLPPSLTLSSIGIAPNKNTWLEEEHQQQIDLEQKAAAPEIKLIQDEFLILQKELVNLLNKNEKLPLEEQLDVLDFDLDEDNRNMLLNEAAIERDNLRRLLDAERKDCDRLSEIIKNNSWDLMEVKGRCIKAMLGEFSVENFALPPVDPEFEEKLKWVTERRKLAAETSKEDHFTPWSPSLDTTGLIAEENEQEPVVDEEKEDDMEPEDPYALSGSSSHQFVPVSDLISSQYEMSCSFNANSEIILLEKVCADLRLHFNKLFDEMYIKKQREMSLLVERNERLRTILSELEITCHAPLNVPKPIDPTWSQEEQTERIVTITDEEVPEIPYVSPSEQDLLDRKAAEEERIRLLLAADNFRERALIVMMDGVLEVRWEDELKKEVPIPKCMAEKDPEDYTEADYKVIKEYEEKCRVLQAERERYRKMLEIEFKRLENTIKESLTKFDSQLFELFITKLKIESAMNHELLKILRIRQLNDNRLRREEEELEMREKVDASEKHFEVGLREVTKLQETTEGCRANFEVHLNKDKSLMKKFKSEFQNTNATLGMIDQLFKIFKRRPKIQQRAALYPTLLNELARLVVDPDPTAFIPPEFQDFLRALDVLDLYSNCPSYIDENIWATLVRLRRIKIESEHRLKAASLELIEAETTVDVYTLELKSRKEKGAIYQAQLRAAKEDKLRRSRDIQLQIVMLMGLVEIPLTGHISDFSTAVVIMRPIVEAINTEVRLAGSKKLAAMAALTNYHRINKYKVWEYHKLKMECEDLETKINYTEKMKVTLEMKQFLKIPIDPHPAGSKKPKQHTPEVKPLKESDFSQEIESESLKQAEDSYYATLSSLDVEWNDLDAKIKRIKIANKRVNNEIINLKCDVSEHLLERDLVFEDEVADVSRKRMAAIVKRTQLVKQIQQAHNDNMVLKTELELLRLKTYPTLKHKSVI